MLACLQSEGTVPELSDELNRSLIEGASSFEHSLRTDVGMLSGPGALDGLSLFNSRRTSVRSITMLARLGSTCSATGGLGRFVSVVKVLWK